MASCNGTGRRCRIYSSTSLTRRPKLRGRGRAPTAAVGLACCVINPPLAADTGGTIQAASPPRLAAAVLICRRDRADMGESAGSFVPAGGSMSRRFALAVLVSALRGGTGRPAADDPAADTLVLQLHGPA